MKKIRNTVIAIMIVVLSVSLFACGAKDGGNDTETETDNNRYLQTFENTEAVTEPETVEPMPDIEGGVMKVRAEVADGKVVATVSVEGNPGLAAFNLTLGFDDTLLRPVSINGVGDFEDAIVSNAQQSADIVATLTNVTALYVSPSNFEGDGDLYTVEFDILDGASGETELTLTSNPGSQVNQTFNEVIFTFESASVTLG